MNFPSAIARTIPGVIVGSGRLADSAWLALCPGFRQKSIENPISFVSKWKILDNIRRSLVPAAMLLLIVVSWICVSPSWLGVVAVASILLLPALPGVVFKAIRIPARFPFQVHARSIFEFAGLQLFQAFFALAVLPFEAFRAMDAVLRTSFRLLISRRKLLQWTVSRKSSPQGAGPWGIYSVDGRRADVFPYACVRAFDYKRLGCMADMRRVVSSPLLAWWISRPHIPREPRLSGSQIRFSQENSPQNLALFKRSPGRDDNFLPADNYPGNSPRGCRPPHLSDQYRTHASF